MGENKSASKFDGLGAEIEEDKFSDLGAEFESPGTPSILERALRGLRQEEPINDEGVTPGDAVEFGFREGPTILGGALGAAAGPAGVGLGAALGRGTSLGIAQGIRAADADQEFIDPASVLPDVVGTGAINAVGARVAPAVASRLKELGVGGAKLAAKAAKMSDDTIEAMLKRPAEMAQLVKTASREQMQTIAKGLGEFIEGVGKNADEAYRELVEKAVTSKPGVKINLADSLTGPLDRAREIIGGGSRAQLDTATNRLGNSTLKKLGQKVLQLRDATPQEAYLFQKDLNELSRQFFKRGGTKVGKAIGEIARETRKIISKELPELAKANAIYRNAAQLADDGAAILKADNPAQKITSAIKNFTRTGDSIKSIAKRFPEFSKRLNKLEDTRRALEAQPGILDAPTGARNFPFMSTLAGEAVGGKAGAAAAGAAGIPFASPRAAGALLRGIGTAEQKAAASPVIQQSGRALAPAITQALAGGAAAAPINPQLIKALQDELARQGLGR